MSGFRVWDFRVRGPGLISGLSCRKAQGSGYDLELSPLPPLKGARVLGF